MCDEGDILNGNINGSNFNDGIVDNERYGMTRFLCFNASGTGANPYTLFPNSALGFYNYMSGYWPDCTYIYYGGTGHFSGSVDTDMPTRFMFPGTPTTDPCGWGQGGIPQVDWSEETEGNPPGDRKGLGVSGPFTLSPGATVELDIAYVYVRAETGGAEATREKLFQSIDEVKSGYFSDMSPCGTSFIYNSLVEKEIIEEQNLSIFPNPANSTLTVQYNTQSDYKIEVLDIQGKVFLTENVSENLQVLDISSLSEGVYFVRISNGGKIENKKLVVLR